MRRNGWRAALLGAAPLMILALVIGSCGGDKNPIVPSDTTAPAAAVLAVGTVTTTSVQLTWTAPGDDDVTGTAAHYDIRYSTAVITAANFTSATAVTSTPTPAAAGTSQSVTVSGLTPNTPYHFAMKTADEVPNWSTISNVPTATTVASSDVTAPAAVVNLATGTVTATSIHLTWTAPGDDGSTGTATTYDIRYSTATITAENFALATAVTGTPTPTAAGTSQSVTVSGLTPNTPYHFAMKTADEVPNWSTISNVPTATTEPAADVTAPAAVVDLATGIVTATAIQLTWAAPGDDGSTGTATTYDIRYSTAAITAGNFASATAVTGVPTPTAAGTSQSVTVSGLTPNTPYYFAMKTADEVPNWSGISNVVSAPTLPTGPDIPTVPVPPLEHSVDLCSTDPVAVDIQDDIQGQIDGARNMAQSGRSFLDNLYTGSWTPGSGGCYTQDNAAPSCSSHYQVCPAGDGLDFSLTMTGTCWLGQSMENWTLWSGHVSADGLSGTTSMYPDPSLPESFTTSTWLVAADGKSGEYKWYNGPVDPSGLSISMNFVEQGDGSFVIHWDVASSIKWDLTVSADGRSGTYDWYTIDYAGGGGWKLLQHTVWADCHGSRTTYIIDPPEVETW